MGNDSLNSKHKNGSIAELTAAIWYMTRGYNLFWPQTSQASCDFVAIKGSEIRRVQVKSAYWMARPSGARYLQATTRKGSGATGYKTYTKEDCDELSIVAEEGFWIIPIEDLGGSQSVTLLKDQDERKARKGRVDWSRFKQE